MKKILLALSLAGTLLVVTTGCGGSDDKKEPTAQEVTLEFKTAGSYDLSQYFIPTENQINNYVEKTYKNEQGQKSYNETADSIIDLSSRFDLNGTIVKEYDADGDLDTTYTNMSDRIRSLDADDNSTMDIVRFAEIGDYIFKEITTKTVNGIEENSSLLCKLNRNIDTIDVRDKQYSDILELTCSYKEDSTGKVGEQDYIKVVDEVSTLLLAKGIGNIRLLREGCESTKLNDVVTENSCTKLVEEITTIN